jgi:hypothetical protein
LEGIWIGGFGVKEKPSAWEGFDNVEGVFSVPV